MRLFILIVKNEMLIVSIRYVHTCTCRINSYNDTICYVHALNYSIHVCTCTCTCGSITLTCASSLCSSRFLPPSLPLSLSLSSIPLSLIISSSFLMSCEVKVLVIIMNCFVQHVTGGFCLISRRMFFCVWL